jgi:hypothetical protein
LEVSKPTDIGLPNDLLHLQRRNTDPKGVKVYDHDFVPKDKRRELERFHAPMSQQKTSSITGFLSRFFQDALFAFMAIGFQ